MSAAVHSSPSSSLPPLPATPTLSSPLNNYTLEIIKFDINTPVQKNKYKSNTRDDGSRHVHNDSSDLPSTPTMPSPPYTPLVKSTPAFADSPTSPTFSTPPETPLIRYKTNAQMASDESPLPSTPKFSSPPYTPLVKGYHPKDDIDTPTQFDTTLSLPSTPTMGSPPTSTYLRDQILNGHMPSEQSTNDTELPPLPETPTLPSPTFTPLLVASKDNNNDTPFNASPLPATPTFKSPPKTPYSSFHHRSRAFDFQDEDGQDNGFSPVASSPFQTFDGFNHSPVSNNHSPVPTHSFLSPSALECDRSSRRNAAWKF